MRILEDINTKYKLDKNVYDDLKKAIRLEVKN